VRFEWHGERIAVFNGFGNVRNRIGHHNVEFRKGKIQDLALDVRALEERLERQPPKTALDLDQLESWKEEQRRASPLIDDDSVDVVVSNCVLNLVMPEAKRQLFAEIFRVLKRGGRAVISDIVSDEVVPESMQADPDLWAGCISGAFQERQLLVELEAAGFHGIAIEKWESEPFALVEGIEFRAVTVTAHKGKQGLCFEANQAVIYAGPWKRVEDDDGHVFRRGERTAVCAKTFALLCREPYAGEFVALSPRTEIPETERVVFDCCRTEPRHPRETKGAGYRETRSPGESSCC